MPSWGNTAHLSNAMQMSLTYLPSRLSVGMTSLTLKTKQKNFRVCECMFQSDRNHVKQSILIPMHNIPMICHIVSVCYVLRWECVALYFEGDLRVLSKAQSVFAVSCHPLSCFHLVTDTNFHSSGLINLGIPLLHLLLLIWIRNCSDALLFFFFVTIRV